MTPRLTTTTRRAFALTTASAILAMMSGCDPRMAMYFLQPYGPTIPAPGPSLKGKKVVVITHATAGTVAEFPGLERDLARQFGNALKKSKKIEVVTPEKVATWLEGHPNWTDAADAARDFEADVAIFLEIEQFQTRSSGDLNVLQGTSKIHIQAYQLSYPKNSKGKELTDQPKESSSIYDDYQETTFPTRGPIPMDSGIGQAAFKNKLLQVVSNQCSWHFIEHPQEDIVEDARIN